MGFYGIIEHISTLIKSKQLVIIQQLLCSELGSGN